MLGQAVLCTVEYLASPGSPAPPHPIHHSNKDSQDVSRCCQLSSEEAELAQVESHCLEGRKKKQIPLYLFILEGLA